MRTLNAESGRHGIRICRVTGKGVTIVYVAIVLVVLVGFVALGVDIGRVHLAKSQLQGAADASARAAARVLRDDLPLAQSRALSTASLNSCMGQAVALDAADVEFGRWSVATRTFSPLTGTMRANAARVTPKRIAARGSAVPMTFASVIGTDSVDASAVAIAMASGGSYGTGIVGIDFIKMNGITGVDSYDSRIAPYNPDAPGENGDITSDGPINLSGNVTIKGDAFPGPQETDVNRTSNVDITGVIDPLPQRIEFPPVDPTLYATGNNNAVLPATYFDATTRDFQMNDKTTFTLVGGTTTATKYYFRDFTIGGNSTLVISGKVEVCVTGSLKIAGTVDNIARVPADFAIRVAGAGSVSVSGASDLYSDLYAPESAVTFNGLGNPKDPLGLFGSVIGKSLTVNGNSDLHYDEALEKVIVLPIVVALVK